MSRSGSRFDRRSFLACGLALPAAVLIARPAAGQCVDPDELSDGVQGMRDSLSYTDAAPDSQKTCSGCAYFKSAKPGDACGNCEVLTSPVSATGHCDSWTKRG